MRSPASPSFMERIGPPVRLAAPGIRASAAKLDRPCTMTARVAEGAQLALLVANDDDGFAGDIHGEITCGIGAGACYAVHFSARLAESSDELPGTLEDA